jgi:uncharacterized protein YggE
MPTGGDAVRNAGVGATVRVLGNASIRVEPDEAFVWLTLTALESSAGTALRDVAGRGDTLARLLDELGIERADRSTTGITVREEFDHTKDGVRSLGHRAAATTVVRLSESERIGEVIMRATTELDARIQGPSWRVSPQNSAWLDAARGAALNAQDKAGAYAAGVGARLGRLVALAEPADQRGSGGPMPMAARASAGGELLVEAGEQEVSACVWGEFELDTLA